MNQAELDNHANQCNPNNDEYWHSRGEDRGAANGGVMDDEDYYDDDECQGQTVPNKSLTSKPMVTIDHALQPCESDLFYADLVVRRKAIGELLLDWEWEVGKDAISSRIGACVDKIKKKIEAAVDHHDQLVASKILRFERLSSDAVIGEQSGGIWHSLLLLKMSNSVANDGIPSLWDIAKWRDEFEARINAESSRYESIWKAELAKLREQLIGDRAAKFTNHDSTDKNKRKDILKWFSDSLDAQSIQREAARCEYLTSARNVSYLFLEEALAEFLLWKRKNPMEIISFYEVWKIFKESKNVIYSRLKKLRIECEVKYDINDYYDYDRRCAEDNCRYYWDDVLYSITKEVSHRSSSDKFGFLSWIEEKMHPSLAKTLPQRKAA